MAKIYARNIRQDEFLAFEQLAQERGSILSSAAWIDVIDPTCIRVGLFQKDGQLIGGFLYRIAKLKILSVIATPLLTPHCALFFKDLGSTKSSALQLEKQVGEAIVSWLQAQTVSTVHFKDMQVFHWSGIKIGTKYTYRIKLAPSIEQVRGDFSSSTKNVLKKADKSGVTGRLTTDGQELHTVLSKAMASKKGTHQLDIDEEKLSKLLAGKNAFALVAEKNDHIVAGGFFIHDRKTAYYILGGVVREEGNSGAGAVVIDCAIAHSKELGLDVFDFEGSMNPGIEHFFRGFGGDLEPYFQITSAKKLQRRLLRLRGRKEF
jgi:hypothetical protein